MKKNIKGIIVGIVILLVSGLLGTISGVFSDFGSGFSVIHIDYHNLLSALIVCGFGYALSNLLDILFHAIKSKNARSQTLITIMGSVVKYAIFLICFCLVLVTIGVNISTVFASVGVMALIVGFGAESLIADMVTGIFMLLENQFNVGDIIEVDGFRGTVESIGIRTISIQDVGGNVKIINNSELTNIVNRSNHGSVAVSEVGVSYSTDLEALENKLDKILEKIKSTHPDVFCGEVSYLGVENLADSCIVLKFKAVVKEQDIFSGRRLLNKELKCAFDKEGIEIAFPQIDVHNK